MDTAQLYGDETAKRVNALTKRMEELICSKHKKNATEMYLFQINTGTFNVINPCCDQFKAQIFKAADEVLR